MHIFEQRHVDIVLIGDVMDFYAGAIYQGAAQTNIRVYEHDDFADGHIFGVRLQIVSATVIAAE